MKAEKARLAERDIRPALVVVLSLLAASCTSTGGSGIQSGAPTIPGMMAEVAASQPARQPAPAATTATQGAATAQAGAATQAGTAAADGASPGGAPAVDAGGAPDAPLPDQIAYVPTPSPAAAFPAAGSAPAFGQTVAEQATAEAAQDTTAEPGAAAPEPTPRPDIVAAIPSGETGAPAAQAEQMAFAESHSAAPPLKRGFFATLFSAQPAEAATRTSEPPRRGGSPVLARSEPAPRPVIDAAATRPLVDETAPAKPVLTLASLEETATAHASPLPSAGSKTVIITGKDALPGVRRQSAIFEITRHSGTGDDDDVDANEEEAPTVRMASLVGMARLDPRGLLLQRETVETACLKPALVGVLKQIEAHFGHKLVITSGYRSPLHNIAAHGARNSLHMFCAAADVQMPGVSKWELASYARSMPGRGGVGTYCYTDSVHIDIGPERDWNWRCRRSRRH